MNEGAIPGVFPFSVLRSDLGAWRERQRAWRDFGLAGESGREHVVTIGKNGGRFAEDMKRQMPGVAGKASIFDPVLTEACYTWYCPEGGRILDPFAGGPVRGLVAGNGGYQYTGIDLSPVQVDVNEENAADWRARDLLVSPPRWILGDSSEVLSSLPDGGFDYVFTCPPYHNLERYSDHPADLSAMRWTDFEETYRKIISESVRCLADDSFCTWVVGEVRASTGMLRGLIPLTIAAHEDAGARFYNDGILLNQIGTTAMRLQNQWRPSRKVGRHHQYVLTFVKGNPKRATAKLPTPDRY
ncbi:class I SAM-dependent methyltransferase [Streptomyces sp. NPDC090442]|uniref:class I SAM-dependent methyltransferase n=1 Tax=Streptomyces sp. NPDC090442 TaxID=3365962 RepID=UPI003820EAE3